MRVAGVLGAALASLALACSSGGGGDLAHVRPHPYALGTPLADANRPATRLPSGAHVDARGVVVVAVDAYDETKDGKSIGNIYVQDAVQPTDWSGMTLYQATKNPADLQLSPGMGVDVSGPYSPFRGPAGGFFPDGILLLEIVKGSVALTYEGRGPVPIDITLDALMSTKDTKDAMKYVARLVRVKDVVLKSDIGGSRLEAQLTDDRSVQLAGQFFGIDDPKYALRNGTKLAAVTGLLNYFYSFKLCPRTPDDIQR